MRTKSHDADLLSFHGPATSQALAPGKRTLTAKLARFARGTEPVQAAAPAASAPRAEEQLLLISHDLPATGGAALPGAVQAKMSTAFGTDFSSVRVHQDDRAGAIGAQAFASGDNLHFAPGQYDPDSESGQSLIGHEVAHVVQQRAGRVAAPAQGSGLVIDDALEREADDLGARAARGEVVAVGSGGPAAPGVVQGKGVVQANDAESPATEQASRTVEGGGGYVYKQYADGTIEIAAGPRNVGKVYPPGDRVNVAITAEIGPFPATAEPAPEAPAGPTEESGGIPSLDDILAGIGDVVGDIGETVGGIVDGITGAIGDFFGGGEPSADPATDAPAEAPAEAPAAKPIDPANHQSRSSFVAESVKENAVTTAILDVIWPYYRKEDVVISGFLTDSELVWKVNYHWDAILWTCDRAKRFEITEEYKKQLDAVAAGLMPYAPNPGKGAYLPGPVGEPEDTTTPEQFLARYEAVKAAKPVLKQILDASGATEQAAGDKNVAISFENACDFVQPPSNSKHGVGYALDFKGDEKRIIETSKMLGASGFDDEAYTHVEFKNGAKVPGAE